MNELKVVVNQKLGSIETNFEALKVSLEAEMAVFSAMEYTDETIGDAKKDATFLRGLKKEIGDRRIQIKKDCLKPYEIVEQQAKELEAIIDKPLEIIAKKTEEHETRRKQAVMVEIKKYFAEKVASLDEAIRDKAWQKIFDDRWLNVTFKKKEREEAIDTGINKILQEIETIKSMPGDFVEEGMKKYNASLDMTASIQYMNELTRQQQLVLEKQRKEKEEQEKREAEAKAEAEEKKRREEEKAKAEAEKVVEAPAEVPAQAEPKAEEPTEAKSEPIQTEANISTPEPVKTEPTAISEPKNDSEPCTSFKVFGTEAFKKVKAYMDFNEIRYEV